MKRKHTKSFLLVSVATTIAGCGGSTDDGADRGSDREAASEGALDPEDGNGSTPMVVGSTAAPFYNGGGTTGPALPQPQAVDPPPGMSAQPTAEPPFVGIPAGPDYGEGAPAPGDPVEPAYGGGGGQPHIGTGGVPVYGDPVEPDYGDTGGSVGLPVEPDYGGAGGSLPFPGEPGEPDYGGAGGTGGEGEFNGGSGGETVAGGAGGAEAIGGGPTEDVGGATNGGDTSDPEDGIGGASN